MLLFLIPLLRLADNLDVSHEGRIQSLSCRIRDGQVVLQVGSTADISLEQWAAERSGEVSGRSTIEPSQLRRCRRMAAVRNPPPSMRAFALQQTRTLLRRLAYQVSRASRTGDAQIIDDLRVAAGRFSRCVRLFGQFLPDAKSKRVRRELKELMDLASTVHSCDLALEILREARAGAGSRVSATLLRERKEAETKLRAGMRRLGRQSFSQKWRVGLRL